MLERTVDNKGDEMRLLVFVTVMLAATRPALAQTSDAGFWTMLSPSLANTAKVMHASIRRNLLEAAEQMPAADYAFKPAPEVRTFAQLIGHVVFGNRLMCAQAKGDTTLSIANAEQLTDKAQLVKALNEALSYCDQVYAETTDANFSQPVKVGVGNFGPADTIRGAVLNFNVTHNNEHYGNIVVYLRLKGIVPPSTARVRQQAR
jgi:uncharacterized damage-inducible protein DinB